MSHEAHEHRPDLDEFLAYLASHHATAALAGDLVRALATRDLSTVRIRGARRARDVVDERMARAS